MPGRSVIFKIFPDLLPYLASSLVIAVSCRTRQHRFGGAGPGADGRPDGGHDDFLGAVQRRRDQRLVVVVAAAHHRHCTALHQSFPHHPRASTRSRIHGLGDDRNGQPNRTRSSRRD